VAPIMRTHCDHCERRIFVFYNHFIELRDAFYLRNALAPYIYSEARKAYETGIAFLHSLYYDFPTSPEAYTFVHQYCFGDSIIAAPISSMVDPSNNQTSKTVWIPPGTWSSWDGSKTYSGPTTITETFGLGDIPLYVVGGSIVPFKSSTMENVQTTSPDLVWTTFPGGSGGSTVVYEDDGDSLQYQQNVFATIAASYTYDGSKFTFSIQPVNGTYAGMPSSRQQSLQLRGFKTPVSVTANGDPINQGHSVPGWYVSSDFSLTETIGAVVVNAGSFANSEAVTIVASF